MTRRSVAMTLGAGLLLLLLGASCSGSSSTPSQPKVASSPSATALDPYRAIVAAQWPAIAAEYTAAPCAKLDSRGMPADQAGCVAATSSLLARVLKLSADLKQQTPPANLATAGSQLKAALDDLAARLLASNQAVDKVDGPGFADAGMAISTAYRDARDAQLTVMK